RAPRRDPGRMREGQAARMPRMSPISTSALRAAIVCGVLGVSPSAGAGRPLFEPTDLEMEDTGVLEVDLQVGGIRGRDPWRAVVPDFEVDLGIAPNLEIDVDGGYAIEGPARGPFSFDHAAPDSLWPSIKVGLYDRPERAGGGGVAFAVGAQVGPKLPVAAAAHGLGVESLALLGMTARRFQLAFNAGVFADPAPDASSGRPRGFEVGLDVGRDVGGGDRFSLTGQLSAVRFVSADPAQLLVTAGVTWAASNMIDVSAVGLFGVLAGGDRYGLLLGVSPKMRLFAPPARR
ncbi:MAG: hypothetical protein ABUL77_04900, partial [Bacteroidota bacterium]